MRKLSISWIAALWAFSSSPAQAVVFQCADGSVDGPVFNGSACQGHGGPLGNSGGTDTQSHDQNQNHEEAGAETQNHGHAGGATRDFPVLFTFKSPNDCVADVTGRAAAAHAGVQLHGENAEHFCRRLFQAGGGGSQKVTLPTTFELRADSCEDQLTSGIGRAHGVVQFENGDIAETACKDLFGGSGTGSAGGGNSRSGSAGHGSADDSENGGHTTQWGVADPITVALTEKTGGCVVHRRCGDYIVPQGHGVAGACGAACSRLICHQGRFVPGGTCGVSGTCDGPNGGSNPAEWCPGDSVAL